MCYSALVDVMEKRSAILSLSQPQCDAFSWLKQRDAARGGAQEVLYLISQASSSLKCG